jgi:hypothetical protein
MFKAKDGIIELQLEKRMAVKTVDRSHLRGQSLQEDLTLIALLLNNLCQQR